MPDSLLSRVPFPNVPMVAPAAPGLTGNLSSLVPMPAMTQPAARRGFKLDPAQLAALVLLGTALGKGRDAIGGFAGGFANSAQQMLQMRQQQEQFNARQQAEEQARQERMAIAAAAKEDQRQRSIASLYADVAGQVPSFKTKEEYDRFIRMAEESGAPIGVRPNVLRVKFPFTAPSAKARAHDALTALLKNPINEEAVKTGQVFQSVVDFDRDNDGIPERVPFAELAQIADLPVLRQPETGAPIIAPQVPAKVGDKFQELYTAKRDRFQAEKGRQPNPVERETLTRDAIKEAGQADDDPTLKAIRALTLSNLQQQRDQGQLTPAQFRMASTLADDFTQQSKDYLTTESAMVRIAESARDPSPAGDLALIFNYMKVLDPNSVVRESEFAQAARTGSLPQQIQGAALRVVSGERLTPQQRQDFVQRAQRLYDGALRQHHRRIQQFSTRARRMSIPPEFVVIEPDPSLMTPEPPSTVATPLRPGQTVVIRKR